MTEIIEKKNTEDQKEAPKTPAEKPATASAPVANSNDRNNNRSNDQRTFKKNRRNNKRREKVRSEFDQKILDIRRVTRVSAGGRRFSFAVSLVAGDRKGKVGIGTGKAGDTSLAIEKAFRNAKKNMIKVRTTEEGLIPHDVKAKYNSAQVLMIPAKGRGIIAGSAVRDVIEFAGLKDINAKIISGTKNKLNISRAAIKGFESLKDPKHFPKKDVKKEAKKDDK